MDAKHLAAVLASVPGIKRWGERATRGDHRFADAMTEAEARALLDAVTTLAGQVKQLRETLEYLADCLPKSMFPHERSAIDSALASTAPDEAQDAARVRAQEEGT